MGNPGFKVAVKRELYEGKEKMQEQQYVKKYVVLTATILYLTNSIQGSSQIVVKDSWFCFAKSALALTRIILETEGSIQKIQKGHFVTTKKLKRAPLI